MIATSEQSVAMYGIVRASKIIGETVVNRQSEDVGKIHENQSDHRDIGNPENNLCDQKPVTIIDLRDKPWSKNHPTRGETPP